MPHAFVSACVVRLQVRQLGTAVLHYETADTLALRKVLTPATNAAHRQIVEAAKRAARAAAAPGTWRIHSP